MKSIWISRTYRDEIREPKQGLRWPLYGRENHTSEQLNSRKWRLTTASFICEAENPLANYSNNNSISLSPAQATLVVARTLCQAIDATMFGWEGTAG